MKRRRLKWEANYGNPLQFYVNVNDLQLCQFWMQITEHDKKKCLCCGFYYTYSVEVQILGPTKWQNLMYSNLSDYWKYLYYDVF